MKLPFVVQVLKNTWYNTKKNYWVGLIPFLPLILLVFFVSDCRICSFYFWEIELSVLATRLLQTLKWEGADCRRGLPPFNPPSPSIFTVRLLFFSVRATFTHFFLRGFHSSRFLLAATLNTRTIFLTTSDAQSLLNTDSGAQTCNISRTTYLTEICSFIFISICTKSIQRSSQKVLQSHWAFESRSLAYIS